MPPSELAGRGLSPAGGAQDVSASHRTDPADKLVRMANQIAAFFRSYPQDEAAAGIHDHIVAFWSPAMRRDLDAFIGRGQAGLDPLVLTAFRTSTRAQSPTDREAAGPQEVGLLGSDAG